MRLGGCSGRRARSGHQGRPCEAHQSTTRVKRPQDQLQVEAPRGKTTLNSKSSSKQYVVKAKANETELQEDLHEHPTSETHLHSVLRRRRVYDSAETSMGRKRRQQSRSAVSAVPASSESPTRMARVAVSDDVWADFRAAIGRRPISKVLGELVEREVQRYRSRRLRDGELDARELVDALERARMQQADLDAILRRLEALRRS